MLLKTFILVLNWNGWRDTLACLASLAANADENCQIVVIDNDSHDESIREITSWTRTRGVETGDERVCQGPLSFVLYDRETAERGGAPAKETEISAQRQGTGLSPLVIIQTGANLGFAGGNNVGIRYALARGADYVLLLNNDAALLNKDSLASLVAFMEGMPKAGACGGRLFYQNGTPQQSYGNFPSLARTLGYLFPLQRIVPASFRKSFRSNVVPDPSVTDPFPIDYPSGAFMLVRAAAIRDIGLLDERYFMYVEETDWCFRMRQAGWGRYCVPGAAAMHKVAGSFHKGPSAMHIYFMESLFRYYGKHFSPRRLRTVVAAFRLRATLATIGWKTAKYLLPQGLRDTAAKRLDHWGLVRGKSAEALRSLREGNAMCTEEAIRP